MVLMNFGDDGNIESVDTDNLDSHVSTKLLETHWRRNECRLEKAAYAKGYQDAQFNLYWWAMPFWFGLWGKSLGETK